jgi:hypothetical protein
MKLSDDNITQLQHILKSQHNIDVTNLEAQQIGLAVMRFVLAKHLNTFKDTSEEKGDENNAVEHPTKPTY